MTSTVHVHLHVLAKLVQTHTYVYMEGIWTKGSLTTPTTTEEHLLVVHNGLSYERYTYQYMYE